MARWTRRRERFRAILDGADCVRPASVHDPVSVRIADDLGFELGMYAGSVASLAVLGAPDLIALTLSEFAEQALRISRAADLPVLADADHGYGNALNVMRTVEELENAGMAGLSIEDTELPQPFGSSGKPSLISVEEGAAKVRAALAARSDPGLVVAGRTSAAAFAGIDEAITRAKGYEAAGADAIFLVGVKSRADLEAVASEIKRPLIIGGGGPELADQDYLAGRNVRVCLQGHQPFAAAVQAIHDTLKALRDDVPSKELSGIASGDLMAKVSRKGDYEECIKRFLE
jgi:carboxyvinyl-carboxyphosphonate phosphorylmutase